MRKTRGDDPELDTKSLRNFLALECPFLLPALRDIADRGLTAPEVRDHLKAALSLQLSCDSGDTREFAFPGIGIAEMIGWTRAPMEELIDGYFQRQEIKASLTRAERIEMYRTMILSRALDELLKTLFDEKSIAWRDYPSPQKGFRALGQEAAVGLALRLRRGQCR